MKQKNSAVGYWLLCEKNRINFNWLSPGKSHQKNFLWEKWHLSRLHQQAAMILFQENYGNTSARNKERLTESIRAATWMENCSLTCAFLIRCEHEQRQCVLFFSQSVISTLKNTPTEACSEYQTLTALKSLSLVSSFYSLHTTCLVAVIFFTLFTFKMFKFQQNSTRRSIFKEMSVLVQELARI